MSKETSESDHIELLYLKRLSTQELFYNKEIYFVHTSHV